MVNKVFIFNYLSKVKEGSNLRIPVDFTAKVYAMKAFFYKEMKIKIVMKKYIWVWFLSFFLFAGLHSVQAQAIVDTDGDGIADHLDLDDDNDGIPDIDEMDCSLSPKIGNASGNGAYLDDIYWFNWSGDFSDGIDVGDSQTFNLPDGSQITVTVIQASGNPSDYVPDDMNTWQGWGGAGAQLYQYYDTPGNNDCFYNQTHGEDIDVTFRITAQYNGVYFRPTIVVSDAESTDGNDEFLDFYTDGSEWELLEHIPYAFSDHLTVSGSHVQINGNPAGNGNGYYVYRSKNISQLRIQASTVTGLQGFAFGIFQSCLPKDTDGDGIADHLDVDSDNDGIYDIVEAGNSANDTDGDGRTNNPVGNNGLDDSLENNDTSSATINYSIPDTDGDGTPDFLDLDSDNDNCSDANEAYADSNADGGDNGYYGTGNPPATDTDGAVTAASYQQPADGDANGTYDYLQNNNRLTQIDNATPANQLNVTQGSTVQFNVNPVTSGTGTTVLTYQWQESQDGGFTWTDLSDGGVYSGTQTNTLTISGVTQSMNGFLYRALVATPSMICDNDLTSRTALLTIFQDYDGDGIADSQDIDANNDGLIDHVTWNCSNSTNDDLDYVPSLPADGALTANFQHDTGLYTGTMVTTTPASGSFAPGYPTYNDSGTHIGITRVGDAGATTTISYSSPVNQTVSVMVKFGAEQEIFFYNNGRPVYIVPTLSGSSGQFVNNTMIANDPSYPTVFAFSSYIEPFDKIIIRSVGSIDDIYIEIDGDVCVYPDGDNDGVIDRYDLDIDNDGIYNLVESGALFNGVTDNDHDGMIDGNPADFGNNGLHNAIETNDTESASMSYGVFNTDGTGNPDYLDIDADDDGIVDNIEGQTTSGYTAPSGTDADNNGVDDAYDTNGTWIDPADTDGDGISDYRDLNSDNDAHNDALEGWDTDNDGTADTTPSGTDSDRDGLDDAYDNDDTQPNPTNGQTPYSFPNLDGGTIERDWREAAADSDGDGIPDTVDLDDDNDGIPDTEEGCGNLVKNGNFEDQDFTDPNEFPNGFTGPRGTFIGEDYNNNVLLSWTYTQNVDGWNDGPPEMATAAFGHQYVDLIGNNVVRGSGSDVTLPGDNELTQVIQTVPGQTYTFSFYYGEDIGHDAGETVTIKAAIIDANNNRLINETFIWTAQGIQNGVIGPKTWYYYSGTFTATTTQTTVWFSATPPGNGDTSAGGVIDFVSVTANTCRDTDNDGIPDYLDLDSDNDGIYDIVEAGNGANDTDHDGRTDNPVGNNGLDNTLENNDTSSATINYTIPNTDGTGNPDYIDIDADDDGIVDNIEGQTTSGYTAPSGTDADNNGVDDAYDTNGTWINPTDTDNDGTPDYVDTNSDQDADSDAIEGWDTNNDGTADTTPSGNDADNDGLDDAYDNDDTQINPTNGQVPADFPDLDNPGGDRDWREPLRTVIDTDGDGIPDNVDLDDDNDGIPDEEENSVCGSNITFSEDFGTGNRTSMTYTTYCYEDGNGNAACSNYPGNVNVNDGEYAILQFSKPYDINTGASDFTAWLSIGDHTGNPQGRMAVFNADLAPGEFYRRSNIPVTPNVPHELRFWIINLMSAGTGGIKPNVKAVIYDNANNVIAQYSTGYIEDDEQWHQVAFSFNPGAVTSITFVLQNNAPGGSGNDLAIDDITVYAMCDTDGDGIPNSLDLDSDDDGIYDIVEAGNGALDTDHDGRTDNPVGNNGLDNTLESDDTSSATINYTIPNTDGTGNPDYLDIDADDDGIVDNIEGQTTSGYTAPSGTDADNNGVDDAYDTNGTWINPTDTDGDSTPDYMDSDSDNDGMNDALEGWDTNNDNIPDTTPSGTDSDGDGLDDAYDNDDTQINPTNGQVPTDFPNLDNPSTPERDWREVVNSSISVVKTGTFQDGNANGRPDAGETVRYNIVITNTGNATLTNLQINDPGTTIVSGTPIPDLNPGDSHTVVVDQTITQTDIDNGYIQNQATITYTTPSGDTYTNDSDDPNDGTNADGADTEPDNDPDDPTVIPLQRNSSLSVEKTDTYVDANGNGVVDAGDRIDYTITITNTGNTTLTNISYNDPLTGASGSIGTLTPGQSQTVNTSYTLTQADIDNGSVSNQATVTYTDPDNNTYTNDSDDPDDGTNQDNADTEPNNDPDDPTVTTFTRDSRMDVTKVDTYVDVNGNGIVDAGDRIDYTITITNTGNTTLTNISYNDPLTGASGTIGTLTPGQSQQVNTSYTLTQADIDAGQVSNQATVTYDDPQGNTFTNDSDDPDDGTNADNADTEPNDDPDDPTVTLIPRDPKMSVLKTYTFNDANANGMVDAGETVTYTVTVENTGNVSLTDIQVNDPMVSLTYQSGDTNANTILDVGETWVYTGTYTVTQADIDSGSISNIATVSYTDPDNNTYTNDSDDPGDPADTDGSDTEPNADPDDPTVFDIAHVSGMYVEKTGVLNDADGDGMIEAGETVDYTVTVANTGNVGISNVVVDDPMISLTYQGGDTNGNGVLDPGEVWEYTGTYTLQQSDIDAGHVDNQATASGTDIDNNTVSDQSDDPNDPTDSDPDGDGNPDDVTVLTIQQVEGITVLKEGEFNDENGNGLAEVGETITYTFTVTNTGNVTLSNVSIDDPLGSVDGGPIDLAPGEIDDDTFTMTYVITAADISRGYVLNQAVVSGDTPSGNTVDDLSDDPTNTDDVDSEGDGEPDDPTVVETKGIIVYEVFSPNGDGNNETWHIDGIEHFADHNVKVYNRWGNLVYETDAFDNGKGWDGTANTRWVIQRDKELPAGTYYYVISLNQGEIELSGFIQLVK